MKAKQIRSKAWNALKGKYWWAVLAALLAWLFGVVSFSAGSSAAGQTQDVVGKTEETFASLPTGAVVALVIVLLAIVLIAIAMSILSGSVRLGYARFNMDLFTDVEKPTMNLMFSRLGILWKAFGLEIVEGLLIGLACLLFIVPGIILALAFSQTEYILAENPDLKIGDVLKKSRAMMKGNKWRLFCLSLSFIGWDILAGLVPGGALLLTPYVEAANAAFYLDLTDRLGGSKDLGELEAKA